MLRNTVLAALFATALLGVDSRAQDIQALASAEPAAAPVAAGITGKVVFRGEAPARKAVDMSSDPVCEGSHEGGAHRDDVRVGAGNGLNDVMIVLTGVPDERYKAPKEAVKLDQVGCLYEPRVFGVMKKQDIEIHNSDATLHNVHAMPKTNKEFNNAMPAGIKPIKKEFKKAEDAILIKCDVHPWMAAYCFSVEHPYFGSTDKDGNVTIRAGELPDGEYGVRGWHPTLGNVEGKVTVAGGAGAFELVYK